MSHAHTFDAIVLATHDIGEADRFCILFTRERGKIAARARGVRKTGSRMGGSLLPLKPIQVSLTETKNGYLITGAHLEQHIEEGNLSVKSFLQAAQAVELLLSVLQDGEPLPEIFETLVEFLRELPRETGSPLLTFMLRCLHHLGLLPEATSTAFRTLGKNERSFMERTMRGEWEDLPELSRSEKQRFSALIAELLSDHIGRPLRAGLVTAAVLQPEGAPLSAKRQPPRLRDSHSPVRRSV